MQRFTELRVWQRSRQLAVAVYRLTATFPRNEQFGITAQVRRAAVSVCANIAEGAKRRSNTDYGRFLNIAEGSIAETEALLRLSADLGFASAATTPQLVGEAEEIARMLAAMRKSVEKQASPQRQCPDRNC
jgi:four helix bundle protein